MEISDSIVCREDSREENEFLLYDHKLPLFLQLVDCIILLLYLDN